MRPNRNRTPGSSDKYGGGRVTFWVFLGMIAAVPGEIFAMFLALFFFTGVGNASTFQMIPVIMRREVGRLMPALPTEEARRQSDREAAAIIAFASAIGAYGGFFIPKAYGTARAATGRRSTATAGATTRSCAPTA